MRGNEITEYLARHTAFYRQRGATVPFEVGRWYTRHDGRRVWCIAVTDLPGYECAQFNDLAGKRDPASGWRYNRVQDRGRPTGGDFDLPHAVTPDAEPTRLSSPTPDDLYEGD